MIRVAARSFRTTCLAGLCAATFAATAQQAAAPPPPAPERVAAAAARTTSAGHTFTAPEGFTFAQQANVVTLQAPEGDFAITIVDLQAKDHDDALQRGWAAVRAGGPGRPLRLMREDADQNGWSQRRQYIYETSPNEKLWVRALVRRAGDDWQVVVLEGGEATFNKRNAAIGQALSSLRPRGYQRETFAGRTPRPFDAARIEELKRFVADGLAKLQIPGAAFAIVEKNRIVFEGGVGVKAMGKPDPVDANTLFIAASNTKSMTSLLMAQAVDAGLVEWDQPVNAAFPVFKLGNPQVTSQVKVKHLLCACTGMPRQDLEWIFGKGGTRADSVFEMLSTMTPTSKLGEAFQYSNLMVGAAGYVAAAKLRPGQELGAAYDDLMRTKIFAPLQMNDTTFDFAQAERGNHARPHGIDVDGHGQPATMALNYTIVAARPAGGVWTSAHDLARYVQMEVARGVAPDGRRLVSERNLAAREQPQIFTSEDVFYGMGLFVNKRYGVDMVGHGGDLVGYHSAMTWMPQHGIGALILTNGDPGWLLRSAFERRFYELAFDGRPEAQAQLDAAARSFFAEMEKERARLAVPADAAHVANLAAAYRSEALGAIRVQRDGAETWFDFGPWKSRMATRKNDDGTVSFITISPGVSDFEFVVGERDGKKVLVTRDAQHEYVYLASVNR